MHTRGALGGERQRAAGFRPAEHALPEAAQRREVEILLALDAIQARDDALHGRRQSHGRGAEKLGLGNEGETVSPGMRCELAEIHRVVRHGEIVVKDRAVRLLRNAGELASQQRIDRFLGDPCLGDGAGEPACGVEPLLRIVESVGVQVKHLPHGLAHVAPRKDVQAHEHEPVGRELDRRKREQRVADAGGNPRIQAVRDHIVERAQRRGEFAQVPLDERHVREPELGNGAPRGRDGGGRKVATDE
jgi:hypothetical protein